MNIFRRKTDAKRSVDTAPLPPVEAYCRICGDCQTFTKCWRRIHEPAHCTCCGIELSAVRELIRRVQPECPQCFEFIEQPTFEYGECDGCGSKYELLAGTQPNLLPNQYQREQMDKVGRVRRP